MTTNPSFQQYRGLKQDPCKAPPDQLRIKRLRPGTPEIPQYATKLSAGMDLRADLKHLGLDDVGVSSTPGLMVGVDGDITLGLKPGESALVSTGLSIELPSGYEAQVRSRSGLALKNGVVVLNSPGTIDADYRGEIGVILVNHGMKPFNIRHGDRIAQLVIARVEQLPLVEVTELTDTERGAGGFGSTGVK